MPSVSLSPAPKLQFFGTDGNPLVGGKVYTYAAGTTTPLTTYYNSTGVTTNTNPIILDTRGEANIWLDALAYKFVLKTSTDTLIWTVDNITGNEALKAYMVGLLAAFEADLANTTDAAKGDALVGFKQSNAAGLLANAVGRTVHQKLQEMVSVFDFGATGNGTTDDTAAIQNAINAVGSSGIYGSLYFPAGTYKITSTLNVTQPIFLQGAGAGAGGYPVGPTPTKLSWAGGASPMIIFGSNGSSPFNGGGIKDMTIDGNQLATVCLKIIDCVHSDFANLGIYQGTQKLLQITNSPGVPYPTGLHTFNNLDIQTYAYGTGTNTAFGIHVDGDISGGQTVAGVTLCSFTNTNIFTDKGTGLYMGNRGDNFSWTRLNIGNGDITAPSIWYGATNSTVAIVDGGTFMDVAALNGMRFDGPGCVFATRFLNVDEIDLGSPTLRNPNLFVYGAAANEVSINGSTGTVWGQQSLNGSRNTFITDSMDFIRWDSTNEVLQTFSSNWKSSRVGTGTITNANQVGSAINMVTSAAASDSVAIMSSSVAGYSGLIPELHPMVYFTAAAIDAADVICRWGFMDSTTNPPTNGVYIEYNPAASSKLRFICRSAGVQTAVNSVYDAAAGAIRQMKIQLMPNPRCAVFGVYESPNNIFETPVKITTNIPLSSAGMSLVFQVITTTTVAKTMFLYDMKTSHLTEG